MARKTAKSAKAKHPKKAVKKTARKTAKKAVKKIVKKARKPAKAKKAVKVAKPRKAAKPAKAKAPRKTAPKAPPKKAAKSPTAKTVTFSLDAPSGWAVCIAGSFTEWEPLAMEKSADGMWRATFDLEPGVYQYKFLVDTEWREDPNNPNKTVNEYGGYNSILEVA